MTATRTEARNLLFITADQWRGECLSALGHIVRTPNIDALAADGTLFTRNFAVSAPCGPSRASIHTGRYVHNHGVWNNGTPLPNTNTTWSLELRNAGLEPVLFGYTDTVVDPGDDPGPPSEVLPGIEPVVELGKKVWEPTAWAEWLASKGQSLPERLWDLYAADERHAEWEDGGPVPRPLALPAELHDTYFMVDRVLDHIRDRSGWCVHLSLLRPHPPWTAPEPYNAMYPPDELDDFVRSPSEVSGDAHPFMRFARGNKHMRSPDDDRAVLRMKASYFGLMTEVDANLGRLFDALKQSGAWEDTMIVFTSDHGEQIGDHHLIGKLGYYDQSYAVPLVIRNPDAEADAHRGARIDAFTEGVDLMPTILDWYGIGTPPSCDGRSMLPATTTGALPGDWRAEAHWENDFTYLGGEKALGLSQRECRINVLRGERFKYVHFPTLPPLLFDLDADPDELVDLAGDPGYSGLARSGSEQLMTWRMLHDDPGLTHLTWTQFDDWVDRRAVNGTAVNGGT